MAQGQMNFEVTKPRNSVRSPKPPQRSSEQLEAEISELEEKLAAAEEELDSANSRIERLEGLLELMGVHQGFALEYVLNSVCIRNGLKALKLDRPLLPPFTGDALPSSPSAQQGR